LKVLNRGVTNSNNQNNQFKNVKSNDETGNVERVQKVMNDINHPVYGDAVQSTLRDLSGISEGINTVNDLFDKTAKDRDYNLNSKSTGENNNDIPDDGDTADREVAATLKMIADAQKGMEGFEASKLEEVGETMMEDMMQQFEALGEKEDYNEVIDGVMRQLLSKDLMYEPTKQICNKFPEWLANNKQNLSELEYNNYGKMYQTFQRLLATYDTEPDNFSR
jgi:signal recognition particle GTPase